MTKKEQLANVFRGESDYIPLIIKTPAAEKAAASVTQWETMQDPQKAVDLSIGLFKDAHEIGCDVFPSAESNFIETLLPSLFGAEPCEAPGGLADVRPIFDDIEDVRDLKMPDLSGGIMKQAIAHLEYIRDNSPEWLAPQISRMYSPLDCAVVLRGGDFYLDLALEPELCAHFLDVITDTLIEVVKTLKNVIGEPVTEQVTVRGLYFPGIRLTNDSIVNLSPAMIEEIYFPCLKKFKETFGNVMLHYCCLPAPSGHVINALLNCDYVDAVDNWQGYETFFKCEEDRLQDKISICTDLPFEAVDNFDEYIKDKPFFKDVKRNGGRGLTITTVAPNIEEGKRLWEKWQKRFLDEAAL